MPLIHPPFGRPAATLQQKLADLDEKIGQYDAALARGKLQIEKMQTERAQVVRWRGEMASAIEHLKAAPMKIALGERLKQAFGMTPKGYPLLSPQSIEAPTDFDIPKPFVEVIKADLTPEERATLSPREQALRDKIAAESTR